MPRQSCFVITTNLLGGPRQLLIPLLLLFLPSCTIISTAWNIPINYAHSSTRLSSSLRRMSPQTAKALPFSSAPTSGRSMLSWERRRHDPSPFWKRHATNTDTSLDEDASEENSLSDTAASGATNNKNQPETNSTFVVDITAADPTNINDKTDFHWTKQNAAIALPALISMLADPILSLVDTAYVGRVGSIELAALGAVTSIFHLAFSAFRATTAATTSLVASSLELDRQRRHANGDHSDQGESENASSTTKRVTAVSLWFGFWVGIGVTGVLLAGGNQALQSMGIPAKTSRLYPVAADYLFTRCWAAPIVLLIGVAEGAFRGYGNTVVPLMASAAAALINLVLDPILMFGLGWGVKGAAAATAFAQVGAAGVYAFMILRNRMLPTKEKAATKKKNGRTTTKAPKQPQIISTGQIIRTILSANVAMLTKQGSLLLGWAYATARATRLGAAQVAAHQVGLSVWLLFAFILEAPAVSAQVLMSRAYAAEDLPRVKSLMTYMAKFALALGLVCMLAVDGLDLIVPQVFTSDKVIQKHLHRLMPQLAVQQVLVSLTLVAESLAVGAKQFRLLAVGTTLSTVLAVAQIAKQTTVEGIWSYGIVTLFAGRLVTSVIACAQAQRSLVQKNA